MSSPSLTKVLNMANDFVSVLASDDKLDQSTLD